MELLSLIIFSIGFALWYAEYDFKKYTQSFILDHTSRAIIRFSTLLVASALSAIHYDKGVYFDIVMLPSWLGLRLFIPTTCILFLGLSCSIFWLWFELRFNYLLDEDDPFYIGNKAWSDRTLRKLKISGLQLFYIKLSLIVLLFIAILAHFCFDLS